ncbi:MAG: disulfide bond formation protein B [Pseudomonadota bacterium]
MTAARLGLAEAAGSLTLLLGAFAFEHLGGLAPCNLCLWQRWPHAAAVLVGGLLLWRPWPALLFLGAAAALTTSAIGFYHASVELGWVMGPTSCSAGPVSGGSSEDLLASIMAAPIVRCNEVAWSLAGISMAGWNALISAALASVWLLAATRAVVWAQASSSASQ